MAKTRLIIYVLMAYGLTYLMGILMWYGSTKGYDLTVFPTAPMMYPAAGVIIGLFLAHKGEKILPAGFFITVLATTGVLIVLALLSVFLPVNDLNIAGMTMSVYNDQTKLEKCCVYCTFICGYLYCKNCSVDGRTGRV